MIKTNVYQKIIAVVLSTVLVVCGAIPRTNTFIDEYTQSKKAEAIAVPLIPLAIFETACALAGLMVAADTTEQYHSVSQDMFNEFTSWMGVNHSEVNLDSTWGDCQGSNGIQVQGINEILPYLVTWLMTLNPTIAETNQAINNMANAEVDVSSIVNFPCSVIITDQIQPSFNSCYSYPDIKSDPKLQIEILNSSTAALQYRALLMSNACTSPYSGSYTGNMYIRNSVTQGSLTWGITNTSTQYYYSAQNSAGTNYTTYSGGASGYSNSRVNIYISPSNTRNYAIAFQNSSAEAIAYWNGSKFVYTSAYGGEDVPVQGAAQFDIGMSAESMVASGQAAVIQGVNDQISAFVPTAEQISTGYSTADALTSMGASMESIDNGIWSAVDTLQAMQMLWDKLYQSVLSLPSNIANAFSTFIVQIIAALQALGLTFQEALALVQAAIADMVGTMEGILTDFQAFVVSMPLAISMALNDFFIGDFNEKTDEEKGSRFQISDLTDVFPFCIPFDLYAAIALFAADPVTPVIQWTFPFSAVGLSDYQLEIDLAPWDSAAAILRTLEDVLFIIGLAFLTRKVIGD